MVGLMQEAPADPVHESLRGELVDRGSVAAV